MDKKDLCHQFSFHPNVICFVRQILTTAQQNIISLLLN